MKKRLTLHLVLQLSSFGKAFSRRKKSGAAGSMSDVESDVSSLYADAVLSVAGGGSTYTNNNSALVMSPSISPIRNSCSDAV